jgi:ABC-2 type transport system permease protein
LFDLKEVDRRSVAEAALREGKVFLLFIIPNDFSRVLSQAITGRELPSQTEITFVGYPSSDMYVFTRSILEGTIYEFVNLQTGLDMSVLEIEYAYVPGTGTMSDFQFGVPGLIVFSIMLISTTTAMTMVREEVSGTMKRIRLSGLRARDLFLGITLAQLAIGSVLVPFTFGCALLMGFQGGGSILLAILVGMLLTMAAVGIGLFTACFARNDGEAANLSAIIGVMMVILSGAMYPMPTAAIGSLAGRTIQIYDLLPPAHAAEAMRRILVYGEGVRSIQIELISLAVLSSVIIALGMVLFQRLKLSR